jgi:hypothetical protein
VVLEFRKLTTQVSVTWMCSVLLQANEFLAMALSADGGTVGADESFQYVIVALADAKLHILPTLYNVISKYQLEDLKTSRFTFLIERLQIAAQFLDGQCIPVPPLALLPFVMQSPAMVLHEEAPIEIRGFAVWAVPTFVAARAPARLCCTGNLADVARVYAYDQVDCTVLPENVETTPTTSGTIFHVPAESIGPRDLIRIPGGDFVRALPDVAIMSNLLFMRLGRVSGPFSLSLLPALIKRFCELWPKATEDRAREIVLEVVREIQNALIGRSLPRDYRPTGVIDAELVEALRAEIPAFKRAPVYIDPRIKSWICQLPRPP